MIQGFLLDTNAAQRWYDQDAKIVGRVSALSDLTVLKISAITLGEFQFGNDLYQQNRDLEARDDFEAWMRRQFPKERIIPVDNHTRYYYGPIKAAIFERYPPKNADENHPEKCFDLGAGSELGIDENDLWIAAQAIQHGLILVANDKMERIQELAHTCGHALRCQDWTV